MQVIRQQPASLNTTRLVQNRMNVTDLVLHIGDISYARGYASVVSYKSVCIMYLSSGSSKIQHVEHCDAIEICYGIICWGGGEGGGGVLNGILKE